MQERKLLFDFKYSVKRRKKKQIVIYIYFILLNQHPMFFKLFRIVSPLQTTNFMTFDV